LKQLKSTFTDAVLFLLNNRWKLLVQSKYQTAYSGGENGFLSSPSKLDFHQPVSTNSKYSVTFAFHVSSHKHVISFLKNIHICHCGDKNISFLKIFIFVIAVTSRPLSRYPLTCVPV